MRILYNQDWAELHYQGDVKEEDKPVGDDVLGEHSLRFHHQVVWGQLYH